MSCRFGLKPEISQIEYECAFEMWKFEFILRVKEKQNITQQFFPSSVGMLSKLLIHGTPPRDAGNV